MNDNLITIGLGSVTSVFTGIIINVTLSGLWEIALYGFVGAGMGYLAKRIIKSIINTIKKLRK